MKTYRSSSAVLPLMTALVFASGVSRSQASEYTDSMDKGFAELDKAGEQIVRLNTAVAAHDAANAGRLLGVVLMHCRNALDDFHAAAQLQPSNPNPLFFRGVTFSRMGDLIKDYNAVTGSSERGAPQAYCAALREINRSITLGMTIEKNPALLVELAAALLGVSDNLEAKKIAVQAVFLHKGDQTRATKIRNDAQKKIDETKEEAKKIHICGKAPPPKAAIVKTEPTCSDGQVQSQFLKAITTGVGYNDNVTQLGRGLPLPPTVPKKGAFFNESNLTLEGDWFFYHKGETDDLVDKLAATYAIIHDAYDGLSSTNTLAQAAGLNYCRAFNMKTCGGLQLNDTWLRSDTRNISNTLALIPSISYAATAELTTQISYSITRSDYSITPSTRLAVLDGFTHQVALQETWARALREGQWSPQVSITGKYAHQWTLTDGIVGDRERDNPLVKGNWVIFQAGDNCSLVRVVTLSASYEYRHDQYDNATFPTLTAANRFKRHDDTQLVEVALSAKLWYDEVLTNRVEAILQYQSITNDSNVAAKAYDQPRFTGSVKVNF